MASHPPATAKPLRNEPDQGQAQEEANEDRWLEEGEQSPGNKEDVNPCESRRPGGALPEGACRPHGGLMPFERPEETARDQGGDGKHYARGYQG